jgi:hypothetical protein
MVKNILNDCIITGDITTETKLKIKIPPQIFIKKEGMFVKLLITTINRIIITTIFMSAPRVNPKALKNGRTGSSHDLHRRITDKSRKPLKQGILI